MGWKMYYNHKDTFFGSRILQIVLKTDQQLSSPFLLMVSMHILGSPSTRMQGNFSEIASCRVQKMAEASANNGSQGKIFLAQAFSNSPLSFLATTAKEEQLSETTASAFNLIIPDGGHCIRLGKVFERLETIAQQFRLHKPSPIPVPDGTNSTQQTLGSNKRAAVLVCLFQDPYGDLRVILTKRASNLSTHSGEVSLPGGKRDEGDADDVQTALREAKEEIGLDPSLVNVVTVLEPFVTKVGLTVVPVLGILSDMKAFSPSPNAAEVEAIFDAPLEMFLKDENRREEEREWKGVKYLLHYFDYEAETEKYVIWALTAGLLIKAATFVFERPPAFLEQRPNFWNRDTNSKTTTT